MASSVHGFALRSVYAVIRRACVSRSGSILCSLSRLLSVYVAIRRACVSSCGSILCFLTRLLCGNGISCCRIFQMLRVGFLFYHDRRVQCQYGRCGGQHKDDAYQNC